MTSALELIKNLISELDIEQLEAYASGELEYWDSGNFDDSFETGIEVGYTQAILEVIEILEEE